MIKQIVPEWIQRMLLIKSCPHCNKKGKTRLKYYCELCDQKHVHLECSDCGYQWNEWKE